MVNQFIAGKTTFKDHPVLYNNFFNFIDLTVKHGTNKPLERDSNAEVSDFALGKAAFMTGKGAWDEEAIKKITPRYSNLVSQATRSAKNQSNLKLLQVLTKHFALIRIPK